MRRERRATLLAAIMYKCRAAAIPSIITWDCREEGTAGGVSGQHSRMGTRSKTRPDGGF